MDELNQSGPPSIQEAMRIAGMFAEGPVGNPGDPPPAAASDTVGDTAAASAVIGQEPAADVAPEALGEPVAAPDAAPVAAPTPDLDPADKRVQALMAREADVRAQLAELRTAQAESAQLKADVAAFHDAKRRFRTNPALLVRSLAPDADKAALTQTVKDLWYDIHPDSAPPEFHPTKLARETQSEVERLRSELEALTKRQSEDKAQQAGQEAERAYVASLQSFATAVPDSLGRVKTLATQKPDMAARLMYQAASSIAAAEERIPTPEEAARAVEQYLADLAYAPAASAPAAPPPASAQPAAPTSLRNSHSAAQAGRTPVDPNDDLVRRRNALAVAGLPTDLFDR